ncbi:MAG: class I SAM-dependent methyltransferase [Bacteroidota bacterium]|nr:class I SAM-dependent methyltransferase [Candidatus Kapabacteria bacterium]MDW8219027.1 class I SAM-dependent methyltransferase [Bacteroidota bacterium]
MSARLYLRFKQLLPQPIKNTLSAINQRFFARRTIQRRYGSWFDIDWRKHFHSLTDEQWIHAYDTVWKHYHNDCTSATDVQLILQALSSLQQHIPHALSIIEVGCGYGTLGIAMSKAGYNVTCLDVSNEALRKAQAHAASADVAISWKQGFAEHLPFADNSFDVLTCCHTLEHVKDLATAIAEMKRVTRHALIILVPKQPFRLYAENYHTQFFPTQQVLINAIGLPKYTCQELSCHNHTGEFHDTALFYTGYLDDLPYSSSQAQQ